MSEFEERAQEARECIADEGVPAEVAVAADYLSSAHLLEAVAKNEGLLLRPHPLVEPAGPETEFEI